MSANDIFSILQAIVISAAILFVAFVAWYDYDSERKRDMAYRNSMANKTKSASKPVATLCKYCGSTLVGKKCNSCGSMRG